jgi:hypothetical protein
MDWMTGTDCVFAYGQQHGYQVLRSETEVRLARFTIELARRGLVAAVVAEAARSVIVFPLGRGPGRPGGEPELDALTESAKVYAERYEAGESVEHYPAWQRRPASGDANDCPNC